MRELIKAFNDQPLVKINGRNYVINPLLDHEPETSYLLIEDAVNELTNITDLSRATKIVGEEDRGGYLAALMAFKHKKSLSMVKWNPSGLEGCLGVDFRNAYTEGKMYLHGIRRGDKVVLVEDLVDSGGTLVAMIELLKMFDVEICDVVAIVEKIDYDGCKRVKADTGFDIKCLLQVSCAGERSRVVAVRGESVVDKYANFNTPATL